MDTILPLKVYPNPILRQEGEIVTEFDDVLRQLAEDMIATMHHHKGIGLAAHQVGRAIRMFVVDFKPENYPPFQCLCGPQRVPAYIQGLFPLVCVNPLVTFDKRTPIDECNEGCLSFPGLSLPVVRKSACWLGFQDLDGNKLDLVCDGILAKVVQHEFDHTLGKLITARIDKKVLRAINPKLAEMRAAANVTQQGQ